MQKLSTSDLNRPDIETAKKSAKLPVVVVLDNVRSALNVGAVFRTCDAFMVERLLLCGITAHPPHREVFKTALGSTESVEWQYYNHTEDAIRLLKNEGYRLWAVEQTTEKTWLQDFFPTAGERHAFVFGNEIDGVDLAALTFCDGAVEIPQFGTKHSLNVSVAAGIVLWELTRKMRF
jgi:tRNA G18 (ribose-2'-O)-methylase SpoU